MKRWGRIHGAFAPMAASVILLAAVSCGDEKTVAPCPVYDVAAFEGQVLAGGLGVEADVGARVAVGPDRGHVLFVTRSDARRDASGGRGAFSSQD